jgi:hypothetical protein
MLQQIGTRLPSQRIGHLHRRILASLPPIRTPPAFRSFMVLKDTSGTEWVIEIQSLSLLIPKSAKWMRIYYYFVTLNRMNFLG